jgi:hypothetical protein
MIRLGLDEAGPDPSGDLRMHDVRDALEHSPEIHALVERRDQARNVDRRGFANVIRETTAARKKAGPKLQGAIDKATAKFKETEAAFLAARDAKRQAESESLAAHYAADMTILRAENELRRSADPRIQELAYALRAARDKDRNISLVREDRPYQTLGGTRYDSFNNAKNHAAHLQWLGAAVEEVLSWQLEVLTRDEVTARIKDMQVRVAQSRERAKEMTEA